MESESHGHKPVRPLDAAPVRQPLAEEAPAPSREAALAHQVTAEEVVSWVGWKATDEMGRSVGRVEDVYAVDGEPRWLLVRHRRSHHFLAPIEDVIAGGEQVFLPYDHDTIKAAPEVDPGTPAGESVLAAAREHYAAAKAAHLA